MAVRKLIKISFYNSSDASCDKSKINSRDEDELVIIAESNW